MPSPKPPHPLLWLVEPLQDDPSYLDKAMFGCRAVHFDGRLVLALAAKAEPWRGVLVPTEREHHASLRAEFPVLAPHPVLPKWLYLPENAATFEAEAQRLVALIRRLDPRIGVLPNVRQRAGGKAPAPPRKHFMLE